ncbi:hypothetical protein [Clostridium baratii]|uniref:hypothetical protein n=1 Tax=Clostridium baratii TaxID=1561 RepID=UPI0030CDE1FE
MANKDDEPLWKLKQVAKFLNYEEITIRRWVQEGKLKCCTMPNNDLRFDPDYIRGLKGMGFKNGDGSLEVKRLNKIIDQKDEMIEDLRNDFCELLSELSVLQSKASQCAIKALNAI